MKDMFLSLLKRCPEAVRDLRTVGLVILGKKTPSRSLVHTGNDFRVSTVGLQLMMLVMD